jgi:hypothetical protein
MEEIHIRVVLAGDGLSAVRPGKKILRKEFSEKITFGQKRGRHE